MTRDFPRPQHGGTIADQETPLQQALRHVSEREERVARQRALVELMEDDHHPEAAALARRILETIEEVLRVSRQHRDELAAKDQL